MPWAWRADGFVTSTNAKPVTERLPPGSRHRKRITGMPLPPLGAIRREGRDDGMARRV